MKLNEKDTRFIPPGIRERIEKIGEIVYVNKPVGSYWFHLDVRTFQLVLALILLTLLAVPAVGQDHNIHGKHQHRSTQKIFNESLFTQITDFGRVEDFSAGEFIIINDIKIPIPETTLLFDERGRVLRDIPEGSLVGIARDPDTGRIVAIIKLSKRKMDELIKKLSNK